jgi:hypothetical protein
MLSITKFPGFFPLSFILQGEKLLQAQEGCCRNFANNMSNTYQSEKNIKRGQKKQ